VNHSSDDSGKKSEYPNNSGDDNGYNSDNYNNSDVSTCTTASSRPPVVLKQVRALCVSLRRSAPAML